MPLIYQGFITRSDLRSNPKVGYVFGDNTWRSGHKGQAAQMRGEHNAIGVVTKWKPTMDHDAFFRDEQWDRIIEAVYTDLARVHALLTLGKAIVWPTDGIGTGLSRLPEYAPKLWAEMEAARLSFEAL